MNLYEKFLRVLSRIQSRAPSSVRLIVVALSFAAIGSALLFISHADSPFVSLEPEDGTIRGAAGSIDTASASNGKAIKFGSSGILTKPNIVLILTDDQTVQSVSKMPYVSSLNDWVSFDQTYVNNGLCCPSRASILSGQFDVQTRVLNNAKGELFNPANRLPSWLQNAGYQTGLFGKYLNSFPFYNASDYTTKAIDTPPGWDEWHAGIGVGIYLNQNYALDNNGTAENRGDGPNNYFGKVITDKLTGWITQKAAAQQPFFAYFTPTATHLPFVASPERTGKYASSTVTHSPAYNENDVSDKPDFIQVLPKSSPSYIDELLRKSWDAAITIDDEVKQIDNTLKAAGVYDNTVVIYASDNGFSFGDNRWFGKICQYSGCSHVPFMVRYPGLSGRSDDKNIISNIDWAPTIAAIAGASVPNGSCDKSVADNNCKQPDGLNFLSLISDGPNAIPWRDANLTHWVGGGYENATNGPQAPSYWATLGTVSGTMYRYVEIDNDAGKAEKELYDETNDPYELQNLAGKATFIDEQAAMKAKLDKLKADSHAELVPNIINTTPNFSTFSEGALEGGAGD